MSIRHLAVSGAIIPLLLLTAPLSAQSSVASSGLSVSGVQAKLYFPETGTFSDDMLAAPDLDLWNTIIGAGWAKHPSNATLVLVTVSGEPEASGGSVFVELTVTGARDGNVKLRRRVEVSFSNGHKRQEAFWIYDTGCTALTLRARLVGQRSSPTVTRTIPFRCGE